MYVHVHVDTIFTLSGPYCVEAIQATQGQRSEETVRFINMFDQFFDCYNAGKCHRNTIPPHFLTCALEFVLPLSIPGKYDRFIEILLYKIHLILDLLKNVVNSLSCHFFC